MGNSEEEEIRGKFKEGKLSKNESNKNDEGNEAVKRVIEK